MGKESNLKGVIDVVRDRAIYFDGPCGEVLRYDEIPKEFRAQHKDTHHELIEHLVSFKRLNYSYDPIFGRPKIRNYLFTF